MRHFHFEERHYQSQAVADVLAGFADGRESILLESPVGSGKTVMGLLIVKALQALSPTGLKVNWVASRRHILRQTQDINENHFHCDMNYVSVYNASPPPADFVVLDEAHHEATVSCLAMYEKTRNMRTLGLSATPLRTDRMRLSFQKTVRCLDIQQLINLGVLSPYHSYKLPEWSAEFAGEVFCQDPAKWGKTIAFFNTIGECQLFRSILARDGIVCEIVTGKSNKDAQLEAFAQGEFPVVANVSVLSEGFDLPEIGSVFLRDASRLPMIQMAGRGLRRADAKPHCKIVQSSTSPAQIEKIAAPQESFRFVRGRWLSCSGNTTVIADMLMNSLRLLEKRKTHLPQFFKATPLRREVSLRMTKYYRTSWD